MRVRLLPYKMSSESGKAIAQHLGIKRLYNDSRSRFIARPADVIINWGCSQYETRARVINTPQAVARACNKLKAFIEFKEADIPIPEFTHNPAIAKQWLSDGKIVYARHKLSGSCGDGIEVLTHEEFLVRAPLYTLAFKSKREYRVHVVNGQIIDYCKKGKRRDREEEPTRLIRNHENGWVFIREGIVLPEECKQIAIDAVRALGLDFGAVDIGWRDGECVVFEINTSPGFSLDSTTAIRYTNAFKNMLEI